MSTVMEMVDIFSKDLKEHKENLIKLKGVKEQIEKQISEEESDLEKFQEEQKVNQLAALFMFSEIFDRRQAQLDAIESIATSALRQIYGNEYSLKFETFDEQRKDGANSFKIEIKIVSPHEGQDMETGLLGERGGGLIEVVSFALRIAALKWMGYNGPILLDEAWKSMSTDYKIGEVASFLEEVTNSTDRQVILVTHMYDKFGPVSKNVVQITKNNGIASAKSFVYNKEESSEEW